MQTNRSHPQQLLLLTLWLILALVVLPTAPAAAYLPDGPEDAVRVLGQANFTSEVSGQGATGIDAAYSVTVDPNTGKVFLTDRKNHRVLRFAGLPSLESGAAAEAVLGQPDMNGHSAACTVAGLNGPVAVWVDWWSNLWVSDRLNNRVLRYASASDIASGAAATQVLGQADFTTCTAGSADQTHFNGPYGLFVDTAQRLWVADRNNHRVLRFDTASSLDNGAPANAVLGHLFFTDNADGGNMNGFTQPESVLGDLQGNLWVADVGNNRVLRFDNAASLPNGANASGLLGQSNYTVYTSGATASKMYDPDGLALDWHTGRLFVADGSNNRILYFNQALTKADGANADGVLGQANFTDNAANRGSATPTASGLEWPALLYYDHLSDGLWVPDFGNRRALLFGAHHMLVIGHGGGESGSLVNLPHDDTSPQVNDATHFGAVDLGASVEHTFTLRNSGVWKIALNGTPKIAISGPDTADFTILNQPQDTFLEPGTDLDFVIRFTPSLNGLRQAHVTIVYTDDEYTNYSFDIAGVGNPYYASNFHAADLVLGQTNLFAESFGFGTSRMHQPTDIAMDPTTGKLFVSDSANNRVLRFPNLNSLNTGSPCEVVLGQPDINTVASGLAADRMDFPRGIYVDADGSLWVADRSNHRVLRFSNASQLSSGAVADLVLGQINFTTNTPGAGPFGMNGPMEVLVDAAENLWVADTNNNRVLHYADSANMQSHQAASGVFGQMNFDDVAAAAGSDHLNLPTGLVMDTTGQLWVTDTGNHRILRFDDAAILSNGPTANQVLGQVNYTDAAPATAANRLRLPTGIAIDAAGRLWVADTSNHRILRFDNPSGLANGSDASGALGQNEPDTRFYDLGGISAQSLHYPTSIAYDPASDSLLIADYGNHRVLIHADPFFQLQGRNEEIIANHDDSPNPSDGTDLGSVDSSHILKSLFEIVNPGLAPFNLSGTPYVEIGGPNASDFKVLNQPSESLFAPGATRSFTIQFTPGAEGLRVATVTIYHSDGSLQLAPPNPAEAQAPQSALGGAIEEHTFTIQATAIQDAAESYSLYLPVTSK